MISRRPLANILLPLFVLLAALDICGGQELTFTPYKASEIYDIGEKVGWTVALSADAASKGTPSQSDYVYTVKRNNLDVIKSGKLDFSSGAATIEVALDQPAMVRVQVLPAVNNGKELDERHMLALAVGAAVAPEKLEPSIPRPDDFDSFWDSKIKMLQAIPENAVLTPKDSGRQGVDFATIEMDNINGAHIYGQIARPTKGEKFPGLIVYQWASPPYPLQKPWVTNHAADGWLTLNIEPHDVLPDQPKPYYAALPDSLKHYEKIGIDDRDKNYFLMMYLADYRAVDYLAGRPDWDGKTLVVMGGSMGGQQSLCVGGLNPKITHVIVDEPSGCDTNGPLHGRAAGFPSWTTTDPTIMQVSRYFDPVNFASRITVPSLVAMGFIDTVSPPAGVWTAFNQIKGPKEALPMIDCPHNNLATRIQHRLYLSGSVEWLDRLVKGGDVKTN